MKPSIKNLRKGKVGIKWNVESDNAKELFKFMQEVLPKVELRIMVKAPFYIIEEGKFKSRDSLEVPSFTLEEFEAYQVRKIVKHLVKHDVIDAMSFVDVVSMPKERDDSSTLEDFSRLLSVEKPIGTPVNMKCVIEGVFGSKVHNVKVQGSAIPKEGVHFNMNESKEEEGSEPKEKVTTNKPLTYEVTQISIDGVIYYKSYIKKHILRREGASLFLAEGGRDCCIEDGFRFGKDSGMHVHQVKRLTDGKVFTIGDTVPVTSWHTVGIIGEDSIPEGTIDTFTVQPDSIIVSGYSHINEGRFMSGIEIIGRSSIQIHYIVNNISEIIEGSMELMPKDVSVYCKDHLGNSLFIGNTYYWILEKGDDDSNLIVTKGTVHKISNAVGYTMQPGKMGLGTLIYFKHKSDAEQYVKEKSFTVTEDEVKVKFGDLVYLIDKEDSIGDDLYTYTFTKDILEALGEAEDRKMFKHKSKAEDYIKKRYIEFSVMTEDGHLVSGGDLVWVVSEDDTVDTLDYEDYMPLVKLHIESGEFKFFEKRETAIDFLKRRDWKEGDLYLVNDSSIGINGWLIRYAGPEFGKFFFSQKKEGKVSSWAKFMKMNEEFQLPE